MPLPRFTRLPAEEQRRILDVALQAFAAEGVQTASYNQIIAAAGISRSSAYNYFDGRDDLLNTVLDDVAERVYAALGAWPGADDVETFWKQFFDAAERMSKHVANNPSDLALLDMAFIERVRGGYVDWVAAFVETGVRLGLITIPVERELVVSATLSMLGTLDGWATERLRAGVMPDPEVFRTVLTPPMGNAFHARVRVLKPYG
ncbi:MAG: TetR/AcrR family transcriptional regulator, partial [Actinomycetia bacterium]|nr:TetR/AcrR family transcriptional regulator [Actinomycetes bacterium]